VLIVLRAQKSGIPTRSEGQNGRNLNQEIYQPAMIVQSSSEDLVSFNFKVQVHTILIYPWEKRSFGVYYKLVLAFGSVFNSTEAV
jgi:hypothetical protein